MATKKKSTKCATKRVTNNTPLPLPCSGWDEADEYLKRLGEHQREIDAAQSRAAKEIAGVKKRLEIETATPMAAAKLLVYSLQVFAEAHKKDFGTLRSKKLNQGKVGWQKSTSIKISAKTKKKEGTLEKIQQRFKLSLRKLCLTTTISVNKQGLHKLKDEQLAKVGARRIVTDDFCAEPTKVKAADTTEGLGDG